MMNTAEGDTFRLLFSVTYRLKGVETPFDDKVLSRSFVVYSNKHNMKHKKQKA